MHISRLNIYIYIYIKLINLYVLISFKLLLNINKYIKYFPSVFVSMHVCVYKK